MICVCYCWLYIDCYIAIVMFRMLFVGISGNCGSGWGDCLPHLHAGCPPGADTEHAGHKLHVHRLHRGGHLPERQPGHHGYSGLHQSPHHHHTQLCKCLSGGVLFYNAKGDYRFLNF